ncbi:putative membrane protein [Chitinispirillum alkaliphilum]|nr:putative membrane protein [Chitinispirillum alkaliphilum]
MKTVLLLMNMLILCFSLYAQGQEQENPFLAPSQPSHSESGEPSEISRKPSEIQEPPFWYPIVIWQRAVNNKLSTALEDLSENFSMRQALLIFLIALGYSLLHTAGPGHGKLILGTYFLTSEENRKTRDAALAGIIVSVTHIGMAFVLSLFLYLVTNNLSVGSQREMAEVSRRIGGVLVIVTGLALVIAHFLRGRISLFTSEKFREKFQNLSFYTLAVLSGIVPCPIAWIVLVFSISYGVYFMGLIAIVGMAIGAAITVTTVGYFVITAREKAFKVFSKSVATRLAYLARFSGGVILLILGILMTAV